MSDFVHLHTHSEFSLLDGMPSVEDYVIKSNKLGMPGFAITDHGNMRSVYSTQTRCKQKFDFKGESYDFPPIKPIFGIEFYVSAHDYKIKGMSESEKDRIRRSPESKADIRRLLAQYEKENNFRKRWHLIALAKNQTGLVNLFKLHYLSWKDGFYYRPRIDFDLLKRHSEGLIISTACIGGYVPECLINGEYGLAEKWLIDMKKIFKDDLYLEIQPHKIKYQDEVNCGLVSLSDDMNIKLIATNDSHYLNADDYESHNVLLAIQSNKLLKSADAWRFEDSEFYFKSRDEMLDTFERNNPEISQRTINESLSNTMEIFEKCNVTLEVDRKKGILPSVEIPGEFSDEKKYLISLCKKGWKWRDINKITKKYAEARGIDHSKALEIYKDRMTFELKRIFKLKFEKYFIIIYDLIDWARSVDILVGPGRGSSAASLVCFLTGITSIDPIEYDLLFDRFLNENRIDYPDIDMDFEDTRRKEIFKYLVEKYGEKAVCQIGTTGRMKGKQALKDVGRVLGVPHWETNEITKHIVDRSSGDARASQTVEDSFNEFDVCIDYNNRHPEVLKFVKRLEGKARQVGIHAAGIQIADKLISDITPIEFRTTKTVTGEPERIKVSSFDWMECQGQGLVKLDVLGLKTLTVLKDTLKQIKVRKGVDINLEKISLDDEKTIGNFTKGLFTGIFQFDSIGMTKTCEKLDFRGFNDIIALNALYRPGCAKKGTKIIVNQGDPNNRTYVKIEDLYHRFNSAPLCVKNVKNNYNIISYDEEQRCYVKNRIVDVIKSGIKECWILRLRNLREIQIKKKKFRPIAHGECSVTLDHKILTLDRGWQRAGDLVYGDYVMYKYNHLVGKLKRTSNKSFKTTALFFYKEECALCDYKDKDVPLDVHHIDGNRENNSIDNLIVCCPNCHREMEYGKHHLNFVNYRRKLKKIPNSYDNPFRWCLFLEKEYDCKEETFDICMTSPNNNFIAGGIVVHNSMRSGLATHYINRSIGKEKIRKMHPIYDDITAETYGVLVYQEQLIRCFVDLAGYDPGSGDELRKKMAKSHGVETMGKESDHFIDGAMKAGVSRKDAESLFENMAFFGSYAFNKAHAAAYGVISYWGMYLKTHYPTEFFCSLMKNESDHQEIVRYVVEARKNGIEVDTPDINRSEYGFSIISENKIVSGLIDIKGCGEKAVSEIISNQPYTSLYDLYNKVNKRKVHVGVIKALAKGGALGSIYDNQKPLLMELDLKKNGNKKVVCEWMIRMSEKRGDILYKKVSDMVGYFTEEESVITLSEVCPIPSLKHKIEFYDFTDAAVRMPMTKVVLVDYSSNRVCVKGTLVDIKYNNVGDFHKEEPSEAEKKRIGWGKRYANVNIEDETGIVRCNIDINSFPSFRKIIDRGLGTPVMVFARMFERSESLFVDIMVDLDNFKSIWESDKTKLERFKKLSPFERFFIKHPVDMISSDKKLEKVILLDKLNRSNAAGTFKLQCLILRMKEHWTKKNKKMAFIDLCDSSGEINVVCWPEQLSEYAHKIKPGNIITFYLDKKGKDKFISNKKVSYISTVWDLVGGVDGKTSNVFE